VLDFSAFSALVGDSLALDLSDAQPGSLLDDLQIDSLCMIEILALFDDHGITLPDALIPELRTMGDLHHYFTALSQPSTPSSRTAPTAPARGQTITVRVGTP
jgi:acyl carrier protein